MHNKAANAGIEKIFLVIYVGVLVLVLSTGQLLTCSGNRAKPNLVCGRA
jgi:hypothetical protein